jgi:hypothetical protein
MRFEIDAGAVDPLGQSGLGQVEVHSNLDAAEVDDREPEMLEADSGVGLAPMHWLAVTFGSAVSLRGEHPR